MLGIQAQGISVANSTKSTASTNFNKQPNLLFRAKHNDTFTRKQPVNAKEPHFAGPSGKYSFLGDLEAEKEAKAAKEKWDDARHNSKISETEKKRIKAEWEEAELLADSAKATKKGIEWTGTILGATSGGTATTIKTGSLEAGAAGAGAGGIIGAAVTLPVAHYVAESKHTIRSKEFQKGYQETRKSGELCIVM